MPIDPWDNPTKVYPVGIHSIGYANQMILILFM